MLASLQAAACPGAQVLTGMPHAPGVSDKVGDLAVEIADLEGRIQILMNELSLEESKINLFISAIENDQTRMIFRLRFLRCLTWGKWPQSLGETTQNRQSRISATDISKVVTNRAQWCLMSRPPMRYDKLVKS